MSRRSGGALTAGSTPRAALSGVVAAGVALLAGCDAGSPSSAPGPATPTSCPQPTPATSTAALPDDIDLAPLGSITRVDPDGDIVYAEAVTEGTLEKLLERFRRTLEAADYIVVGSENEVVEADVFFSNPQGGLGAVKFIPADCEGQVVVELFIDRG